MGILNQDFKEELAELILLVLAGNTNDIIKQLVYMKIIAPGQNTDDLKADIDDLLNRYYGADLKNMDGAIEDLLNVMVDNNVILPKEFVMIGRGITLIEDTGKKLDPDFNAASELRKLSGKIILNKYRPERLGKLSIKYLLQLEHLAKDLPETLNSTISKLEEGDMKVKLELEDISELANQLSVSLILSALVLGSSLALLSDVGPTFFDIPLLGLVGFIFSAVLGGFLVVEYMLERD